MHKPMTAAERLTADITALRAALSKLDDSVTATLCALNARLTALEDAVTKPEEPPLPPKPVKLQPPAGYVTVKTMCSEADLSYNAEAANMLRHYARHFCTAMELPVWRRPDVGKGYDHFPREAADYAIDRVKKEMDGIPVQTGAPLTQPHTNGQATV